MAAIYAALLDKNHLSNNKNGSIESNNDSSGTPLNMARVDGIDDTPADGPLVDDGAKYSAVEIVLWMLYNVLCRENDSELDSILE